MIWKTSGIIDSLTQLGEDAIKVGGDSRAGRDGNKLDASELNGNEVDDDKVEVDEIGKKVQETFKSKNLFKSQNLSKSKKTIGFSDFLIPGAKLAFIKLRQAFFKAPILYHFDLECHIRIEKDVSGYAIGGVLSQLTSDDLV